MLHSGCHTGETDNRHALVKMWYVSGFVLLTISFSGVTIWMRLQAVVSTPACNSRIHWWLVGLWRKTKSNNKRNEYSGWWYACMAFLLLAAAFFFSSCSRTCPLCTCIPLVVCEECHIYTLAVHNLTSHVSCMCSFCGPPFHSPHWRQVKQWKQVTSFVVLTNYCCVRQGCCHLAIICESIHTLYIGCLSYVFAYMCVLTIWLLWAFVSLETSKVQGYTAKAFVCALLKTPRTATRILFCSYAEMMSNL